jgi:hypothetical protein
LLLGTCSFELWFESYLGFIVESLYFWKITEPPSSSTSSPSSPLFLCARRPAALAGHVLYTRRPRAALSRATCRPSVCAADPHPTLALSSPCHAALPPARTALRRCSPSLQPDRRHLLFLAAPTRRSPIDRRSSSPRCLLLHAPCFPRLCPSSARGRHARRRPPAPALARCALSST